MRAIWTGSIAFGLVNVPVKLYSATENHDVRMHQVHDEDHGRIRYQRRCEECDEVVEYSDIERAYDDGDHRVIIHKEDFEALPSDDADDIEVLQFVPSDQIDSIMLEKSYYLEPTSKTPKAYLLLRQTLEETDRTAIVKITLRTRTRLAILRICDKVLMIQTLRWADEIREADFKGINSRAKISDKELEMSKQLVESYSEDFTPEEFEDDYQVELRKLIDAKIEAGDTVDLEETFADDQDDDERYRRRCRRPDGSTARFGREVSVFEVSGSKKKSKRSGSRKKPANPRKALTAGR